MQRNEKKKSRELRAEWEDGKKENKDIGIKTYR